MLKIKELREELGLTQKELAQKSNTTNKNIWAYEKGLAQPSIEMLIKLAKIFEVSVDYLIDNIDENKSEKKSNLTSKEQRLLKAFQSLDNDEQNKIIEDCEYFANKHIKTKKANV